MEPFSFYFCWNLPTEITCFLVSISPFHVRYRPWLMIYYLLLWLYSHLSYFSLLKKSFILLLGLFFSLFSIFCFKLHNFRYCLKSSWFILLRLHLKPAVDFPHPLWFTPWNFFDHARSLLQSKQLQIINNILQCQF